MKKKPKKIDSERKGVTFSPAGSKTRKQGHQDCSRNNSKTRSLSKDKKPTKISATKKDAFSLRSSKRDTS